MRYMSVDLETTGLIPSIHGITEFGAVFGDDQEQNLLPETFYRWLDPEGYVWSTYCLQLHAKWIERVTDRIAKKQFAAQAGEPKICRNVAELAVDFMNWYQSLDATAFHEFETKRRGNITGAGKNFGSFDLQFLKAWKFPDVFRHRQKEWVPTYELPTDKVPPDLKTCKERAILMGLTIKPEVAHTAIDDALDVYHLIQFIQVFNASHRQTLTSDPRQ